MMDKKDTLERLRAICSKAEKSPKDILDRLKQWKYDGEPNSIIDTLREENFIDEKRYASAFINDKIKFSKWGKIKIKHHLKHKGIEDSVIDACIKLFPHDEYFKIAKSEVIKKNKMLKEDDTYKRKQKLISFGAQRGFEMEYLYKIVDSIINSES